MEFLFQKMRLCGSQIFLGSFTISRGDLRMTLFKTEDEIGTETLALHFFATEIGHKNVRILLKLAETLA